MFVYQSTTTNLPFLLRILDPDPVYYENFKNRLKMRRYGSPLVSSRFIEDLDVEWDATAPRGLEYWRILSDISSEEPVRQIDKTWTALLKPLGIEKGKPFTPTPARRLFC